jgi:hypothetical protein
MANIRIDDLELEPRSIWFLTMKRNDTDYYMKKHNHKSNSTQWTKNINTATGYLNALHATKIKQEHFKNRDSIFVVERTI